ncbi:MAG TPA: helix-hairpin-helix domain-containing protein [Sediminibacterium sp.]|nr:helix-hairpin-helix domain-containing protein [Sediminibacterium sp.]
MKQFFQQYLRFSRKERIGLSVLLIILAIFLWLPEWYGTKPVPVQPDTAMMRLMEAGVSFDRWSGSDKGFNRQGPNRQRYIQPYAQHQRYNNPLYSRKPYQPRPIPVININTAGPADWEALPGIGPVLAARIIKYRDKLGGFTRMEQVRQTYGISDSLYRALQSFLRIGLTAGKSDTPAGPRVGPAGPIVGSLPVLPLPNANTATRDELEAAGIPEHIARAIVVFRSRYGLFSRKEDLRRIILISDSLYRVISGKLRVE